MSGKGRSVVEKGCTVHIKLLLRTKEDGCSFTSFSIATFMYSHSLRQRILSVSMNSLLTELSI